MENLVILHASVQTVVSLIVNRSIIYQINFLSAEEGGGGGRRGGGGRGGGGGGGGGGRNCYNCGEPGHLARDCPSEQQQQSYNNSTFKFIFISNQIYLR